MIVVLFINGFTKIITDNLHVLAVSLGRKILSKVFSIDYYIITMYPFIS